MEKVIADVRTLWNSVVLQGTGLQKLEGLVTRMRDALNNQAQGLRNAENRIAQLEALLMRSVQQQQRPMPPQPMRTINPMQRAPLRALPSTNERQDFVEVDDASADYETDEDEEDVG